VPLAGTWQLRPGELSPLWTAGQPALNLAGFHPFEAKVRTYLGMVAGQSSQTSVSGKDVTLDIPVIAQRRQLCLALRVRGPNGDCFSLGCYSAHPQFSISISASRLERLLGSSGERRNFATGGGNRGGKRAILLSVDQLAGEGVAESLTGQLHKGFSEQFDLMIKGKGLDELKKYRLELISRGIVAGEIPDETFFGHHPFAQGTPTGTV
jgi:hypothetical protein